MDRNQVIGFVLIFVILVVWSIINTPTPEEIEQAKEKERLAQEESIQTEVDTSPTLMTEPLPADTLVRPSNTQFGIFANTASGSEEIVELKAKVFSK